MQVNYLYKQKYNYAKMIYFFLSFFNIPHSSNNNNKQFNCKNLELKL